MLIDCYVKPGHYDFLFKTLSFKTRCPVWFLLLWEHCFNRVLFPGWALQLEISSEKEQPPSSWVRARLQHLSQDLSPTDVIHRPCERVSSAGSLSAFMLGSCPLPCKPFGHSGPWWGFSWLPSVLLSSIPVLIENKSFQLKIHAFFSSGTFFLLLFLYFSLSLFCSLLWSPVIIYKLCLSFLPLNYHQGAWGKCRIPGPRPDLLLQNLLHPKTPGLCVHIKIRLKRISLPSHCLDVWIRLNCLDVDPIPSAVH